MDLGTQCKKGAKRALRLLKAQAGKLRSEIEGVRAEDPDAIHDMRVASRRTRAILKEHKNLFPNGPLGAFEAKTRELTRALGEPRELDVTMAALASRRASVDGPLRRALEHALFELRLRRSSASPSIERALMLATDAGFDHCLKELVKGCSPQKQCITEHAPKRLVKRFDKLVRVYDAWLKDEQESALHQVRIACKKLRYTCEVYQALYGKKMARHIRALKKLQTLLGDWNDLRILGNYVGQCAFSAPPPLVAGMNALRNALDSEAGRLRHEFRMAAAGFFAEEQRKACVKLFESPAANCCGMDSSA